MSARSWCQELVLGVGASAFPMHLHPANVRLQHPFSPSMTHLTLAPFPSTLPWTACLHPHSQPDALCHFSKILPTLSCGRLHRLLPILVYSWYQAAEYGHLTSRADPAWGRTMVTPWVAVHARRAARARTSHPCRWASVHCWGMCAWLVSMAETGRAGADITPMQVGLCPWWVHVCAQLVPGSGAWSPYKQGGLSMGPHDGDTMGGGAREKGSSGADITPMQVQHCPWRVYVCEQVCMAGVHG